MTTPTTTAGAVRAHLNTVLPAVPVYRDAAPTGTNPPVIVLFDGLAFTTVQDGPNPIVAETVQLDLYTETGTDYGLPDQVHAAVHRAVITVAGATVYRLAVTGRTTDLTDPDPATVRTVFTLTVIRTLTA